MSDDRQYPSPAETAAAWDQTTQVNVMRTSTTGSDGYASPGPPPWGALHQDIGHNPPKRRVPLWAWFLVAIGTMFVGCSIGALALAGGSGKSEDKALTVATTAPVRKPAAVEKTVPVTPAAPVYKLGVPIRGGDFTFTIHSKKCGLSSVGNEYLSKKPQGTYCRIDMTVKNVTSKPHIFLAQGSMTVTDTKGRTFAVDGEAGAYGNKNPLVFMDTINPGNAVRGYVFFDVSGGVKLADVRFEAGLFTLADDVTVPLP